MGRSVRSGFKLRAHAFDDCRLLRGHDEIRFFGCVPLDDAGRMRVMPVPRSGDSSELSEQHLGSACRTGQIRVAGSCPVTGTARAMSRATAACGRMDRRTLPRWAAAAESGCGETDDGSGSFASFASDMLGSRPARFLQARRTDRPEETRLPSARAASGGRAFFRFRSGRARFARFAVSGNGSMACIPPESTVTARPGSLFHDEGQ